MGAVYLAEKTEPFVRQVALKVLRAQTLTETARIRFQLEQEMLARLSHPHIAQLYEAGTSEDGAPFFAMELIDGRRIARYCAEENLSVPKRLRLFLQVCSAVQFAHQRGVLHRDLKPSNILVREDTREPAVKLIDFGIAKAINELHDESQDKVTLGTPAYMAPESFQAEPGLDTRSDVYSLGLVLQEILTDTNPAGGSVLDEPSATQEALLLSSETSGQAETVAVPSEMAPRHQVSLGGDLGAIISKATASAKDDRYDSALGLADDIRRHLDREPVLARSSSALYRLGKLLVRHGLALSAAALVLTAIGISVVTTAQEARRANQEAQTSSELARFMVELFEVVDPSEARGKSITAKEVLDRGAERILTDRDAPKGHRARLALTMGGVYRSLGLYRDSRPLLDLAIKLLEQSTPDSSALADALVERGRLLNDTQDDAELARRGFERALEIRERLHGADSPEWAVTALHASAHLRTIGSISEAAELSSLAASRLESHPQFQSERASALGLFGSLESRRGSHESALEALRRALALSQSAAEPDPATVGDLLNSLSVAYLRAQDYDSAIQTTRELLAVDRQIYGDKHNNVANDVQNLAFMLYRSGKPAEALSLFADALALRRETVGEESASIGRLYRDAGLAHLALGDLSAARENIERGTAILGRTFGVNEYEIAVGWSASARLLQAQGAHRRALELIQQAREVFVETVGTGSFRVKDADTLIAELSSQLTASPPD